ncbi:hypothetical protein [Mycoplasma sp. VS1572C]
MKKFFKWSLGLLLPALSTFSIVSCKKEIHFSEFKDLDLSLKNEEVIPQEQKYQAFENDIIDSAQNPYPSVFISRNASQYFIASQFAMLAHLEMNKDKSQNDFNDVIYLIDSTVNQYNKTLQNKDQRFNFKYLLDKYGDKLKNPNGKLTVLDNTKYINNTDNEYEVFVRNLNELKTYLNSYLDKTQLFDFYIPDISFTALDDTTRDWIITHANKIVILSDGNAQPYWFIRENYLPWVLGQNTSYTQEELLEHWNNGIKNQHSDIDYHYFYTLKDKFKIYNSVGDYSLIINKFLEANDKSWAKLEINSYPLNFTKLSQSMSQHIQPLEFSNDFSKLTKINNKSLLDLVTYGKENYDPNKKNLVFIGSSLFRPYSNGNPRISETNPGTLEAKGYIQKIFELYPAEEYNYFYKLHPAFKNEHSIQYVRDLTSNKIDNAIILDSSVSWENMVAMDLASIQEGSSILFDKDDFKDGKIKTKLFGLQATTTTLLTTISMLQEFFNISLKDTLLFVDPKNFPIPEHFHLITRDNYKNNYLDNLKAMEDAYFFFIHSGNFPKLDEFISMSEFLKLEK